MLETTLIFADPGMGTLGTNVVMKRLLVPKQGCLKNLMPHTSHFRN